ncbi:MAG: metallopeptidase TldD-related protein [Candidatus Bipolaricaulota bacterium]
MRDLIEQARRAGDAAELYWLRERTTSVAYENWQLHRVTEEDLSSVAVRAVHEGRMGTTFGTSPEQAGLLDQARRAAALGDPPPFRFAPSADYRSPSAYDEATDQLTSGDLIALCEATRNAVRRVRPDVALILRATAATTRRVVQSTEGSDAEDLVSGVYLAFGAPIRGAGVGVVKSMSSVHPLDVPLELVAEFDEWYGWTQTSSTPKTGKYPAIFAPEASFLYLLPLWATLSGSAFAEGTSPLLGREGAQILSPQLTIHDDPGPDAGPNARAFDDEGTPCARRALIERGILRGLLLDLRTAAVLGRTSTGNGLKRELFDVGTEISPNPWPIHFSVAAGTSSVAEMIRDLDEGLLVTGGLGFHSGNYRQGQFAVQALGFHVRNGKVVGRLDRTMISCDIYRDLLDVPSLSAERRATHASMLSGGLAPYVLVGTIQVAGA